MPHFKYYSIIRANPCTPAGNQHQRHPSPITLAQLLHLSGLLRLPKIVGAGSQKWIRTWRKISTTRLPSPGENSLPCANKFRAQFTYCPCNLWRKLCDPTCTPGDIYSGQAPPCFLLSKSLPKFYKPVSSKRRASQAGPKLWAWWWSKKSTSQATSRVHPNYFTVPSSVV